MSIEAPARPSLENGDRLSRAEFERRYALHPELKKAELVHGVVYVASPVSLDHARAEGDLGTWLGVYRAGRPGLVLAHNATIRLGPAQEPQPDLLLMKVGPGSSSSRDRDGMIVGPPELVAEIARSSVSYDLHDKKALYAAAGVQEYIAWRVEDEAIDWFRLRGGSYELMAPDERGVLQSEAFPGLRLDVAAMLRGDFARVLAELNRAP